MCNTFKKLLPLLIFFLSIIFVSSEAMAEKKIGVLLWNKQKRYLKNVDGVVDYLKQNGYGKSAVTFTIESADGNKSRAVEAARKFVALKMDMVITVGTTATVIAANEIKKIPLVFVMVWDPVESKIAKSWQSSGNNTTGVSSKTSSIGLLRVLKEFPHVKRVAVLYTPGERNTEIQLREFIAEQNALSIKIVPVPLSDSQSVKPIMSELVTMADAVCLSGSSIIGTNLSLIVDIATKARVITASQSEDLVDGGALLGVTVDPYAIGRLAGEKALRILTGSKPSSIPIVADKKLDIILNKSTMTAGQFQIPPALLKKVTKTVE